MITSVCCTGQWYAEDYQLHTAGEQQLWVGGAYSRGQVTILEACSDSGKGSSDNDCGFTATSLLFHSDRQRYTIHCRCLEAKGAQGGREGQGGARREVTPGVVAVTTQ